MNRKCHIVLLIALVALRSGFVCASMAEGSVDSGKVRAAVSKSLPLLEASAEFSRAQRRCFTCHHVGAVSLTANAAWLRGFEINEANLSDQIERTQSELKSDIARFMQGRFLHGKGDLIGHSSWLLKEVGWPSDDTTTDMLRFLVGHDLDRATWQPDAQRPPTVGSPFTTTFVVLQALKDYRSFEVGTEIRKRSRKAVDWLLDTASFDNEDSVYRLRALHLMNEFDALQEEGKKLLQNQRKEDGGWAQLPQMRSGPYATGTALAALIDTGVISTNSPVYHNGIRFLLKTQEPDGSWHVASRTAPRQPFYHSDFPHSKDQFISVSATAWATYALLEAFPVVGAKAESRFLGRAQTASANSP